MDRSELSDLFLAEPTPCTRTAESPLLHAHLQVERSALFNVQLLVDQFVAYPRESDSSFDLWRNFSHFR